MNRMTLLLWAAGAVHFGILAANAALPRKLRLAEELPRLSPFLRQVFLVHWLYILLVVALFGILPLLFAAELAATPLGRFLSGFIAAFWLTRIALQLFYYDASFRRENRLLDSLYLAALVFLVAVFGLAALAPEALR
jgi:hypothetical protein